MTPFVLGSTCWRMATATRAALLVDNEQFYSALHEALLQARRSVVIVGWAFDPRTRLAPDGTEGPDDPDEIGRILIDLAAARPDLTVRLLIWKSSLSVNGSHDFLPHRARRWFGKTRVKFRLDDRLPLGACHHQKVIVIDDHVAFCGGGDIVTNRWDSNHHHHVEPKRLLPDRSRHPARHEVTLMVEGPIAKSLGELVEARWRAAGEPSPPAVAGAPGAVWPTSVAADFRQVQLAVARTAPSQLGRQTVTEIFELTLACIAQARKTIYLENQYFTSPVITEALAARLAEPDGPEVVLVLAGRSPSWFDRLTMDHSRNPMVRRLRTADPFGRFRAYAPRTTRGAGIIVHSKVAVFDDRILRVGSANLNNRSAGFDTECELAIKADSAADRLAVTRRRDDLVSHFLAVPPGALESAGSRTAGLGAAIDRLNREGRLTPLLPGPPTLWERLVSAYHLGDPSDVSDSWRVGRRRRRLQHQVETIRRMAAARLARGRSSANEAGGGAWEDAGDLPPAPLVS